MIVILLLACKAPPTAPSDFDELCSWLYEHHQDKSPALLAEGLDNVAAWTDAHRDELTEGYRVSGISAAVADELDGGPHEVDGIYGVALLSESTHTLTQAAQAMVIDNQEDVQPGRYEDYRTQVEGDADCFVAGDCDRVELEAWYTAHLFLGINSENHDWHQYRWVDAEQGTVMAHRAWLMEPPTVTGDLVDVLDQYYLDLFMPVDGGLDRLQVSWIVIGGNAMPESTVQAMLVDGMTEHSANLEAWMDASYSGE